MYSKANSAVHRATDIRPKHMRTSQLREMMNRQHGPLTRAAAKGKPRPRAWHKPCKALSPYVPSVQPQPHRAKGHKAVLTEAGSAPNDRAGNFVLIFPFNEATFGASRNGLNVERIIQELQKLMNK